MNNKRFFVVEEDTNLYNIFDRYDFNEDGYLNGYEEDGYHLSDFEDDIVFAANDWETCEEWVDKQLC